MKRDAKAKPENEASYVQNREGFRESRDQNLHEFHLQTTTSRKSGCPLPIENLQINCSARASSTGTDLRRFRGREDPRQFRFGGCKVLRFDVRLVFVMGSVVEGLERCRA